METLVLGTAVGAWAAIHSWLASSKVKQMVRARYGDAATRSYRLAYNVFSAVTLAPLAPLMRLLPDRQIYAVPPPWTFVLLGGQALALLLMLLALLQTDMLHFAGISQLLARKASSDMVTTGFYGVVRHPLYLFGLLILWLSPSMTANQLTVTSMLTVYLFIGAVLEERRLVEEFGSAYETYRTRTPMILPGLRSRSGK